MLANYKMVEFKNVNLANESGTTVTRGASIGSSTVAYTNQPIMYGDEIIDAAKNRLFFLQTVNIVQLPEGHKDYVEYKRTKYLGSSGITFDSGEKAGSEISNTALDNQTGVVITPTFYSGKIHLENYSVRVNVHKLVELSTEELVYGIADKVDTYVATTIGDATEATNSAAGATMIYGGDATSDSTLTDGDIMTPELIADGIRYLEGTDVYYWNGVTFTKVAAATATKNGWVGYEKVLFIGPAQKSSLVKDSQFTNAAEYGSDEVILNGEIGKYLDVKVISTNNVEKVASGGTAPDGGAVAGANMTRCILCVPKKAFTFVWGIPPEVKVFDMAWQAAQAVTLETAYAGKVIHDDSIIFIDVTDD